MSNFHEDSSDEINASNKSSRKRRSKDAQLESDDSNDEMPDVEMLKKIKRMKCQTATQNKSNEDNDDDKVVYLDTVQGCAKWWSQPYKMNLVKKENPVTIEIERTPDMATSFQTMENPQPQMENMLSSMFNLMQSQTNFLLSSTEQQTPSSSTAESTAATTRRSFLEYLNVYINSLNSPDLMNLHNFLETKIEKLGDGDKRISVEKFCLAIEAAVAIISV